MPQSHTDDPGLSREVDSLLGQLKTRPFSGPGGASSNPRIVASPKSIGDTIPDYDQYPWPKVVLVGALGVALAFWPYSNGCGVGLVSYFMALGVLMVTAAWALNAAWREHTAWAYGLGLAIVVWGSALSLTQILPRVGYARHTAYWSCSAGMDPVPEQTTVAEPVVSPATGDLGDLPPF